MLTATSSRLHRSVQVLVVATVVVVTLAAALPVETANSTISASSLPPSATTSPTPSPKRGRKVNLPLILGLCLGLALPVWLFLGYLVLLLVALGDFDPDVGSVLSIVLFLPLGPFTLCAKPWLRGMRRGQDRVDNRRHVAAMRRRVGKP